LILVAVMGGLYGCKMWGTVEVTYTFNKLDSTATGAENYQEGDQTVLWTLTDGTVTYNVDLTYIDESRDESGGLMSEVKTCKIVLTGKATATVGPDGSVSPPSD
jgi:hypothetical protein